MNERWLPVVGYEGRYEVSDCGRVRSLDRIITRWGCVSGTFMKRGIILKPTVKRDGRPAVSLWRDGRQNNCLIHQLVLAAFVGPRPASAVSLHWDDNPQNNNLSNLRYGSQSENQRDRARNGNHFRANQTECIHGHAFTPENTYMHPDGFRKCRECQRRISRERRARIAQGAK